MNPEIIGWAGCILNAVILVPQTYDIIKTRKVRDISLTTYVLIVANSILWTAYGAYLNNGPLIVTNLIQLLLSGIILFMKLKYKK